MASVGKRLKEARLKRGMSQAKLADEMKGGTAHISRLERNETKATDRTIHRLAHALRVSPKWLKTGKGPMVPDDLQDLNDDEFVYLPQVTGKIAAGDGLVPDNTIELKIAFRKDWISRKGDPRKMSLIRVQGDSMEPTLLSGDLVLIDHNRDFIDLQGGIYAVAVDGDIMIKRVQLNPKTKKVAIISDNDKYASMEFDQDELAVNGKMIWFGREVER